MSAPPSDLPRVHRLWWRGCAALLLLLLGVRFVSWSLSGLRHVSR